MKTNNSNLWRNRFHIEPPTGLLNDPNGLIYHEGVYHVFYQWHPDSPTHGLKYWNHLTSKDLVNWESDPWIIKPDTVYETHGSFSGSACLVNDKVTLFYTGNTRDESYIRHPYQLKVDLYSDEKTVIIDTVPDGYTAHFRDPKVFYHNNQYLMIIGGQNDLLQGRALIYSSDDTNEWQFRGELDTPLVNAGFMWECPDLIEYEDSYLFLFCPQGLQDDVLESKNIYPSTYLIGNFDDNSFSFKPSNDLQLVDYGFDFYAPQTFKDENDVVTMFGWMGLPESGYPTDKHGWANLLTFPRVLEIKDNHLYQNPHPNLEKIVGPRLEDDQNTEAYIAKLNVESSCVINVFDNGIESLVLVYNDKTNEVCLDRSNMMHKIESDFGTTRKCTLRDSLTTITILRDTSCIEIFLNDGEAVFTSRFFADNTFGTIKVIEGKVTLQRYKVEK